MSKIKIDTQKSLYEPIEIEIDEKNIKIERITPALIEKTLEYEKEGKKGDPQILMKQFCILTGVGEKVAKNVDIRDMNHVLNEVLRNVTNPRRISEQKKKE